jgi:hypothetical protein
MHAVRLFALLLNPPCPAAVRRVPALRAACATAGYLRGAVLAQLVRPGMSMDQAGAILGTSATMFATGEVLCVLYRGPGVSVLYDRRDRSWSLGALVKPGVMGELQACHHPAVRWLLVPLLAARFERPAERVVGSVTWHGLR